MGIAKTEVLVLLFLLASQPTIAAGVEAQPPVGERSGSRIAYGEASGSRTDSLVDKARSLMSQRRYADAARILQDAVRHDPQSTEAHFSLGAAYYQLRDLDKAIAEYQAVLALQPGTPEAMFNMGNCYQHLRQYDAAINCFENYLQASPNSPDAATVRGAINDMKKNMEVVRLFKESRELLQQKHPLEARFMLETAVKLEPESPEIHYNLGMAYHNIGNLPKAIEEFQRALQLKPDMTDAMLNIGSSYQALGQKPEAISWFQRYLQACPQASDAKPINDLIASMQKESGNQVDDDPHGPDFFASMTRQGSVRRWPQNKLPIKVFIDMGNGVPGMRESFPRILVDSLDSWMKASQGRIAYQIVQQKDMADLVCDWTNNPGDVTGKGTEAEQGVARVFGKDYGRGVIELARATIRVLTIDREKGGQQSVSDDVMKKTCLHEAGHALGLMGHSPNSHDVMFFSESPTVWPVLSKRDKATLLRLYESYPATFGATPLAQPPY